MAEIVKPSEASEAVQWDVIFLLTGVIPLGRALSETGGADLLGTFVLAVTFAAGTAFLSPVGYQTNLFVYGPGGYDFSDYARIGGPLQVILAVVTTLGIAP